MNCPNCGRPIEYGEICQCSILDVAKRQSELSDENQDNLDREAARRGRKVKEQSERMERASEKANEAADAAVSFANRYVSYFKDVKEFVSNGKESDAVVYSLIHYILSSILVYLTLTRSPISIVFTALSVFTGRPGVAIIIGAMTIAILPMAAKMGSLFYKAKDNWVREAACEYIHTIPVTFVAIIVMLISGMAGMVFLLPIYVFGSMNLHKSMTRNGMDESKSILAVTLISLVVSILSMIVVKLIA